VARDALRRVRRAGERTWERLKSTTSEAVERLGDRWGRASDGAEDE
jgi:hypothetical protein